mgnify:CR=1 FL=1
MDYTYTTDDIVLEIDYDYEAGDSGSYFDAPEPCKIEINAIYHEDIEITSIIEQSVIEDIKNEIQTKHE